MIKIKDANINWTFNQFVFNQFGETPTDEQMDKAALMFTAFEEKRDSARFDALDVLKEMIDNTELDY